jgi:hypothetical protein
MLAKKTEEELNQVLKSRFGKENHHGVKIDNQNGQN